MVVYVLLFIFRKLQGSSFSAIGKSSCASSSVNLGLQETSLSLRILLRDWVRHSFRLPCLPSSVLFCCEFSVLLSFLSLHVSFCGCLIFESSIFWLALVTNQNRRFVTGEPLGSGVSC
ncbi:hypothetical protein ACOSQ4_003332 [Xanthoceras sorbifolium]